MPLYEKKEGSVNRITISEQARNSITFGNDNVIDQIIKYCSKGSKNILAFDGWYGIDWETISKMIIDKCGKKGISIETINTSGLFKSSEIIREYKTGYITEDPGFGRVNSGGAINDIMGPSMIKRLKRMLETRNFDADAVIVYSYGSAIDELVDLYDLVFYFDKTLQQMLQLMWEGKVIPLGYTEIKPGYDWKEYYYCDFYLLFRHKQSLLKKMDYYIETAGSEMKMIPADSYNEILKALLVQPVKEVPIYQPGPWGAYRYKDLWDIEGLECNAWNELAGPELSVLIDIGAEKMLNIPFLALLQHDGAQLVGGHIHSTYPGLFPLDIWLDDGYFPVAERSERTSMPIHNHPDSEYVKRHFNEPLGRYETYYIIEAYEGANTWLGYKDDCDLEEWEKKCRESENRKEFNWKDYIHNCQSCIGDLYLIPPGTTHAHGGNQMVLEMDTCCSIPGTEYSFFLYDFARNSWDDKTKTMTGKPVKMHLEHGFDNDKWRRGEWAEKKLRSKPVVTRWNRNYWVEKYETLPEMPFEIERINYYDIAENDTKLESPHLVTLAVGRKAVIRSKQHPERCCEINILQSAVIPAGMGVYELVSADGGYNQIVILRWKTARIECKV